MIGFPVWTPCPVYVMVRPLRSAARSFILEASMGIVFRVLLTTLLLSPAVVFAQGFGVYEQGACVMSRGGAGVAQPCDDGASIYVNPAGLAGRRGPLIAGGITGIIGQGSFTS